MKIISSYLQGKKLIKPEMGFIFNFTFYLIWSAQIVYASVVGIHISKKVKVCKLLNTKLYVSRQVDRPTD